MIKKSLIFTTLLIINLNAQNLKTIVDNALRKNYTLKSQENGIDIAQEEIALSSKWNNPILAFGATDIQLNNVSKRDKEPMQAYFVGITQDIPLGEKLEIQKNIAIDDYEISKLKLDEKKLQLKSSIYNLAFKIKLFEERLSLFKEFEKNSLNLIDLLKELSKYNKASQKQILDAQVIYKKLTFESKKIETQLKTLKLNLEKITYQKIDDIDFDTKIYPIKLSKEISTHPKINELLIYEKRFGEVSNLEIEKKNSDLKMNVTYFQREQLNDYINLSFSIPLSVDNKEDIKAKKANLRAVQMKNKAEDLKIDFKKQIEILQQNIDDSLITYNIIIKDILPKQEELKEILKTYNSFNSFKSIDSRALIQNQNEIIQSRLNAVNEKEKFFTALAKSYYFNKDYK